MQNIKITKSYSVINSPLTLSTLECKQHGTMLGCEQLLEIQLVASFLIPWPATTSFIMS